MDFSACPACLVTPLYELECCNGCSSPPPASHLSSRSQLFLHCSHPFSLISVVSALVSPRLSAPSSFSFSAILVLTISPDFALLLSAPSSGKCSLSSDFLSRARSSSLHLRETYDFSSCARSRINSSPELQFSSASSQASDVPSSRANCVICPSLHHAPRCFLAIKRHFTS